MADFRQLPSDDEVFFDHLAHFVPDMEKAQDTLTLLGFVQTPYTLHRHTVNPEEEPVPTGTANRCIMFPEGYIEIITVSDKTTAQGARTQRQLDRYTGLHLMAFSTDNAEDTQGRLTFAGFHPEPLVHLKRPVPLDDRVGTANQGTAEFTVCRLVEDDMPEGRIFFLKHHTQDMVWQERWLTHDNGIIGLRDGVIVADDLEKTVARMSFFLDSGTPKRVGEDIWRIKLARGGMVIAGEDAACNLFGDVDAPDVPSIMGYGLLSRDLKETTAFFDRRGFNPRQLTDDLICIQLPDHIGGNWLIAEDETAFPWVKS